MKNIEFGEDEMIKPKPRNPKLSQNEGQENSLIEHLVPLMKNVNDSYGPAILGELQSRLEKTIDQFNEEIEEIVKKSFETYRAENEKVRKILVPSKPKNKSKNKEKEENTKKTEKVPQFISDYEKKKTKPKKKKTK